MLERLGSAPMREQKIKRTRYPTTTGKSAEKTGIRHPFHHQMIGKGDKKKGVVSQRPLCYDIFYVPRLRGPKWPSSVLASSSAGARRVRAYILSPVHSPHS